MVGGGLLSLSLLSRGIGEVQRNGHEKVEALLEPSDFYNLASDRPFTLPDLQTVTYRFQDSSPGFSARDLRDVSSAPLPKTFSSAPLPKTFSSAPLPKTFSSAPLPKTFSSAPLPKTFSSAPLPKTFSSAPLPKTFSSAPLPKTFTSAPLPKTFSSAPLPKTFSSAPLPKTFSSAPLPKTFSSAPLPKTFTTRKGALILFSEDLALKTKDNAEHTLARPRRPRQPGLGSGVFSAGGSPGGEDEVFMVLKTVEDLAKSVLQYGGAGKVAEDAEDQIHMKFIHPSQERWERQIRPGYSAKRYLSTWTRTWDSQVVHSLLTHGFLKEHSQRLAVPQCRKPLFYPDMSSSPQPYRLTKSMLLTPGSLSGFSFYRIPDIDVCSDEDEGTERPNVARVVDSRCSIRVIRTTADGVREEIRYSALDKAMQGDLLVDLLVKSALHFFLTMQDDMIEDSMAEDVRRKEKDVELQSPSGTRGLPLFDMRKAVESLLDSERGRPFVLGDGGDLLAETEGSSARVSDRSGPFSKRSSLALPEIKPLAGRQTSRDTWTSSEGRELPEDLAGGSTTGRGPPTDTSSECSLPRLPPVSKPQLLSPIKDVSREASLQLPALRSLRKEEGEPPSVHVMPATPQHSTLTALPSVPGRQHPVGDTDRLSEASGYNMSSDSSVAADPSLIFGQRSGRRSKAKGSKRRSADKAQGGSSLETPSLRGSMVMAPDGEIINVGGAISPRHSDVGVLRDVTSQLRHYDGGLQTDDSGMSEEDGEEWKGGGRGRKPRSTFTRKAVAVTRKHVHKGAASVTEQDIVDTLTKQARQIADALLDKDGAGANLERDVKEAADMWMESHPARDVSRPGAEHDELKSEALEELMAAYRDCSSTDPTAAGYRHLIRQSLSTAVAKAAGLSPEQVPEDLQISPELLEALVSQTLSPDHLTIVYDAATGRPVITSRQEMGALRWSSCPFLPCSASETNWIADGEGVEAAGVPMSSGVTCSEGPDPVLSRATPRPESGQKEAAVIPPTALLRDAEADDKRADKPLRSAREVFAAGTVDLKADLSKTLAAASANEGKSKKSKKEAKKKGRKGKTARKDEESGRDTEGDGSPPPSLTKTKEAALSTSEEPQSPRSASASSSSDRALQSSSEEVKSDDDTDLTLGQRRREDRGEPSSPQKPVAPLPFLDDEDEDEEEDDSEEKSQANREARAARRAAAAAKRKEEVERRRREREEQLKMSKGEQERQEQLRREMEMERLRREEERMLQKRQEEEEAEREEREKEEGRRRRQLEEERERREREEHQRRLEDMRREQMEEEARRHALQEEREREEDRRRAAEELMLSQMAEQERALYEQRKREQEEARRRQEEEERRQREEEAQRAMAEARRLAEEMARQQAALEAKLRFNRSLRREARSLGHSHDINRAFVFSYFQLMQWLGLDMPQFDSFGRMKRYY